MADFRKGDVCSLEVVVSDVHDDGTLYVVTDETPIDNSETLHVYANAVTLIRRAPVDLASCDLPVEARWVNSAGPVTITQRGKTRAIIELSDGYELAALLSDLRPADSPAPAAWASFDVRAYVEGYVFRGGPDDVTPDVGDKAMLEQLAHAFTCVALIFGPLCLASAAVNRLFRQKGPDQ